MNYKDTKLIQCVKCKHVSFCWVAQIKGWLNVRGGGCSPRPSPHAQYLWFNIKLYNNNYMEMLWNTNCGNMYGFAFFLILNQTVYSFSILQSNTLWITIKYMCSSLVLNNFLSVVRRLNGATDWRPAAVMKNRTEGKELMQWRVLLSVFQDVIRLESA